MSAQYSYGHRLPHREHQQRPRPAISHDEKQHLLASGVYRPERQPSPAIANTQQCTRALHCKPENYRAPSPPRISTQQLSQKQARDKYETYQLRSPPPQYQPTFPHDQFESRDEALHPMTPPPQYQPAFSPVQRQFESKPFQQPSSQSLHPPPTQREQQHYLRIEQQRPPVTHSRSEPQVGHQLHAYRNNEGHRPPAVHSRSESSARQTNPDCPTPGPPQSLTRTEVAQTVDPQPQHVEQNLQSPPRPQSFHAQFVSLPMFTLFTHYEAAVQQAQMRKYLEFKAARKQEVPLSTKATFFMMDMASGGSFIGIEEMARGIGKLHEQAAKLGCKEIATVVLTRWAWTGKRDGGKIGTLLVDVLEYRWKINMTPIRVKCSATETVKIILSETKEAKIKQGKAYTKENNYTHVEKVAMIDADGKAQAMEMIVRGQCGCSAVEWNEMKERFHYGWHVPRIGW